MEAKQEVWGAGKEIKRGKKKMKNTDEGTKGTISTTTMIVDSMIVFEGGAKQHVAFSSHHFVLKTVSGLHLVQPRR